MLKQKTKVPYLVSICDDPEVKGALRFTFVPTGLNDKVPLGQLRQPIPEYIVTVVGVGEGTTFTWLAEPEKATVKTKLEHIAKQRVSARHAWLELLRKLVTTVKTWAEELGWATKLTEKKMDEEEIGNYKAPAHPSPKRGGEALPGAHFVGGAGSGRIS